MRIARIVSTVFGGIGVGIATHWLSLPSNGCPRDVARTSEPPTTSTLQSRFSFGVVRAHFSQRRGKAPGQPRVPNSEPSVLPGPNTVQLLMRPTVGACQCPSIPLRTKYRDCVRRL